MVNMDQEINYPLKQVVSAYVLDYNYGRCNGSNHGLSRNLSPFICRLLD